MAILILSRLMNTVKNYLSLIFNKSAGWTDSSAAYAWIKNNKKQKTFIENRVTEIKRNLKDIDLKLVASELNPADIVSKGCKISQLVENKLWFQGPDFLSLPENQWPNFEIGQNFQKVLNPSCDLVIKESGVKSVSTENQKESTPSCDLVIKKSGVESDFVTSCNLNDANTSINEAKCRLSEIIDVKRFSSFDKLVRVTAYVFKFLENVKQKIKNEENYEILNKRLCAGELLEAKIKWFQDAQRNIDKDVKQNLYLVGGVLRWKGRLENAPIPFESKHPIYLPTDNPLVELLIKKAHYKVMHNGQRETLNELRTEFQIPKLRQKVRSFIYHCGICKKFNGKAYRYPESYDLPKHRLEPGASFRNVGIDYCGPYYVYNVFNKNNESFKVWIALITCQASRAIYLDLATDYSGEAYIALLRRFMNRRGIP